jgi:hypothetical protein
MRHLIGLSYLISVMSQLMGCATMRGETAYNPAAASDYERQASAARECAIQEMKC